MIYIVDLEDLPTRYTTHWKKFIPGLFPGCRVISGNDPDMKTDAGAFLCFADTIRYKSEQAMKLSLLFQTKVVEDGDVFLFTDAWNPNIISLRYMAELNDVKIKIIGMWHAGSYDPWDFLGRKVNRDWCYPFEKSIYNAIDVNLFATIFHTTLMTTAIGVDGSKARVVGWPMEYTEDFIKPAARKEDIILFPHRVSVEKQPDIFTDLAEAMPEYEFIITQEVTKSKEEYHELLGRSKMVLSFANQETLGICGYEALCAGSFPLVPDRLSYREMYRPEFKYPTEWSSSLQGYNHHRDQMVERIRAVMRQDNTEVINQMRGEFTQTFFSSDRLVETVNRVAEGKSV